MKLGIYIKHDTLESNPQYQDLLAGLRNAGAELYRVYSAGDLREGTDMLVSVGGDGTFLSASKRVGDSGVPVLGVNLGRLGFLSENRVEEVLRDIPSGNYSIEDRALLDVSVEGAPLGEGFSPYALNEVAVHRRGAAVLGVEASLDGQKLPVYWADGLLVATSSGSTAYSLSVGGPICMPESKVLIIAPIAPHNLNVRPLVVPDSSSVSISVIPREDTIMLSMDNRSYIVPSDVRLSISVAQFSLKRVRLSTSGFVKGLTAKLFWGEDVRNGIENRD